METVVAAMPLSYNCRTERPHVRAYAILSIRLLGENIWLGSVGIMQWQHLPGSAQPFSVT